MLSFGSQGGSLPSLIPWKNKKGEACIFEEARTLVARGLSFSSGGSACFPAPPRRRIERPHGTHNHNSVEHGVVDEGHAKLGEACVQETTWLNGIVRQICKTNIQACESWLPRNLVHIVAGQSTTRSNNLHVLACW